MLVWLFLKVKQMIYNIQMNARQLAFCDEYLSNGMNATQAYIKTYKVSNEDTARNNGARLLANASIKNYVAEKQRELQIVCGVRKEHLIQDLIEVKNRCLQEVSPKFMDPGVYVFNAKGVIAAIAQISRMLGFDAPVESKVEMTDKTAVKESIENIRDAINRAKNATEGTV